MVVRQSTQSHAALAAARAAEKARTLTNIPKCEPHEAMTQGSCPDGQVCLMTMAKTSKSPGAATCYPK